MIAKINFDGKDRVAIVFNEFMSFENLNLLRHSLNSYMKYANLNDSDFKINEEASGIHTLLEEMEYSTYQEYSMAEYYFSGDCRYKKAEKKTCVIYI